MAMSLELPAVHVVHLEADCRRCRGEEQVETGTSKVHMVKILLRIAACMLLNCCPRSPVAIQLQAAGEATEAGRQGGARRQESRCGGAEEHPGQLHQPRQVQGAICPRTAVQALLQPQSTCPIHVIMLDVIWTLPVRLAHYHF